MQGAQTLAIALLRRFGGDISFSPEELESASRCALRVRDAEDGALRFDAIAPASLVPKDTRTVEECTAHRAA